MTFKNIFEIQNFKNKTHNWLKLITKIHQLIAKFNNSTP